MKQLHNIQIQILKKLLFSEILRFTELKPDYEMGNNQFNFHLKTLIEKGYIIKDKKNYSLTKTGKEYANRIDTDKDKIDLQAKLSAWVCCTRTVNGKRQYLIGTRQKQPFFGKQGFIAGKIQFGESVIEACRRELKEEANLEANGELVAIKHYRVYDKETKKLLEDKFMFLTHFQNPKGKMKSNQEVLLNWIDLENLETEITNPFESIDELMSLVNLVENHKEKVVFDEISELTDSF